MLMMMLMMITSKCMMIVIEMRILGVTMGDISRQTNILIPTMILMLLLSLMTMMLTLTMTMMKLLVMKAMVTGVEAQNCVCQNLAMRLRLGAISALYRMNAGKLGQSLGMRREHTATVAVLRWSFSGA